MTTYLCNAFSLNMLPPGPAVLDVRQISQTEAGDGVAAAWSKGSLVAAIGHESTAAIVAAELGHCGPCFARVTVTLDPGDCCIVAQYVGPRLAEGVTSLPEGARLEWRAVSLR